ncbi:hypothetical protein [Massilia sp. TS11]|uniref:hypothetical protein n=1 Tax=Massilia sp. TS11 TaxID=2908003 RepID=UPI001EDA337B|nr:hypothetical protein [Massilia sp. TS11]MCG2586540.1 hypothetical protein [Massilia sp. TS11]
MDIELARKKWRGHVDGAKSRGLGYLTFQQYILKLAEAGIEPSMVGLRRGMYNLARFTDRGDYTPSSCRFITVEENQAEQAKNGGLAAKIAKLRGRTKESHKSVASQAEKLRGRTKFSHPGIAVATQKTAAKLKGRTKENDAGRRAAADKTAIEFAFIDPLGIRHTGRNMTEFAQRNGLTSSGLARLRSGYLKTYHGWTLG